jgi:hypothetical protein
MTDADNALGDRVDRATDALDRVRESIDNEAAVREQEVAALSLKFVTAAQAADTAAVAAATANRAVAKNRRTGRWVAVALGVAFFALSAGLVNQYRQDQADEEERVRQAVVACNNANLSRKAILDQFDVFITLLGSAGNPPPTQEAATARRELIEKFRQDFRNGTPQALKPRDCSEKAVMSPTPLTSTTVVVG